MFVFVTTMLASKLFLQIFPLVFILAAYLFRQSVHILDMKGTDSLYAVNVWCSVYLCQK